MKAKVLFTATVLAFAIGTSVNAADSKAVAQAKQNLRNQLQDEIKSVPFEDIGNLEECCTLMITFRVNEDNSVEILKLESKNEKLVRHATILLKENDIVADDLLRGHKYRVPVKFVDEA